VLPLCRLHIEQRSAKTDRKRAGCESAPEKTAYLSDGSAGKKNLETKTPRRCAANSGILRIDVQESRSKLRMKAQAAAKSNVFGDIQQWKDRSSPRQLAQNA
jgi:hypothetical protein